MNDVIFLSGSDMKKYEHFYAVKNGRKIGICATWDECKGLVTGYPKAVYKKFDLAEAAINYMLEDAVDNKPNESECLSMAEVTTKAYAFVDGSFNPATNVYGYGGFINVNGEEIEISGCGDDADVAKLRNIAGELIGAMAAVVKAKAIGLKELTIYYDYLGIEAWVTGAWRSKNEYVKKYSEWMNAQAKDISLTFVHVKGHTDIEGNERVDQLAKQAVGVV